MSKTRPSLKDIAKELNISVTTVSFVLNGKGREKKISKEVIERIEKYIESINYKPNPIARSLRTGRSGILVFMVEDISNYFFAKLARIMEDLGYKHDYKMIFCSTENNDRRSKELIHLFRERQVDGFFLIPSSGIEKEVKNLIRQQVPVVLFDRYFPGLETNQVMIDNGDAAFSATEHLINQGYKSPAFITTDVKQTQMTERLEGYEKALKKYGLTPNILKIPFSEIHSAAGKELIATFLSNNPETDSMFFATNYLTQSGLEVIKYKFPGWLDSNGVLTFDDNDLFRINTPSITAIAQPLEEIGKHLMSMMMTLVNSSKPSEVAIQQQCLKAELIQRESTQRH
ncbi:LacI family DNA-binding transcriptional regulator [Robertkochia solimangrovi]|uniref:LacI family DNA-binding transcriptional regulator n=1 Tax=Robertkochia solimangrovi TaxID=2213046 RepID=UPI0011806E98|nr:LacI family DNA-binding transcriptional regulator [Robertkochia solimangrovi]TRZ42061.1 LacI family transcriptional regulator [Robertkochia solimangrovi]